MKTTAIPYQLYETTYQFACWLINHTGPLAPTIVKLGQGAHKRFVPRSYYDASLNPVRAGNLILHHDEHESSSFARSIALGMYEVAITRLMKTLIKPGMTVLDVGANIGYFSLVVAQLVGESGGVWAFEPVPHLVDIISNNIRDNGYVGRIHIVPEAVNDAPGTVELHVNAAISAHSSLYSHASAYLDEQKSAERIPIKIASTSLDTWAAQKGWPTVDLVKMDVEGAERLALEGMVELCRRTPGLKLIIEFNIRTLHAAGTTPEQFIAALRACGFETISIVEAELQSLDMKEGLSNLVNGMQRDNTESVNLLCAQGVGRIST